MKEKKREVTRDLLISRYLSGQASLEDFNDLLSWLNCSKENLIYFQQVKNIWDVSGRNPGSELIDAEEAFSKIKERIKFKTPRLKLWHYWKNIAAVLLIPLFAGNILYYSYCEGNSGALSEPAYNEVLASFGTRSSLKLSDGSIVWLNSGSSLKYPDRFSGNERIVSLKGEAYFEIESDIDKPFIVKTSSLSVIATGTKFNVTEYSDSGVSGITLVSGKIEVSMKNDNSNQSNIKMDIKQHLSYNRSDGTYSIINVNPYQFISWKEGVLIFRNDPLITVVNRIGQIFNVDIELRGEKLQNYRYRATFKDESLEEILKLLKLSSPIDYVELKRDPLPDGTFPRKKVIIFPAGDKI